MTKPSARRTCGCSSTECSQEGVALTRQNPQPGRRGDVCPLQFILFADNIHGQTTDEFKSVLLKQCNTLLRLLPAGCTDEIQPVDAGYGRIFKVHVDKALDKGLLDADHVELGGQIN